MNIRINNMGVVPTAYLGEAPRDKHFNFHIVKYMPNDLQLSKNYCKLNK